MAKGKKELTCGADARSILAGGALRAYSVDSSAVQGVRQDVNRRGSQRKRRLRQKCERELAFRVPPGSAALPAARAQANNRCSSELKILISCRRPHTGSSDEVSVSTRRKMSLAQDAAQGVHKLYVYVIRGLCQQTARLNTHKAIRFWPTESASVAANTAAVHGTPISR